LSGDVTLALQAYADRGVFRGFRAAPASRGRIEYQFLWLTRRPMTAVSDPRRRTLSFPALFPAITRDAHADLRAIVAARATRGVPAHKRIDARKLRVSLVTRKGDVSLSGEMRGANHDYAVKTLLNLINELFVCLHEAHPEYLVHQFGISTE
jgi:hypothetical protein